MQYNITVDNSTTKIKTFLLNLLFPKFCLGCQKEGSFLCEDCKSLLDISEFNYCLCEKDPKIVSLYTKLGKCGDCQNKKLSGLYFALPYKENPLTKKLIFFFKYDPYIKELSKTLSDILVEHFIKNNKNTNEVWGNSVLIPVPLDIKKLKSRGYNQSEELAKELSKTLSVPVFTNVLIKTKNTKPQMELNKQQREENLNNVFKIKNAPAVLKRKVFLIDDVYTTGSTMQECANVLRQNGAKEVWGITIARESL